MAKVGIDETLGCHEPGSRKRTEQEGDASQPASKRGRTEQEAQTQTRAEPGRGVDLEDMRKRMQATIGSSVAALTTKLLTAQENEAKVGVDRPVTNPTVPKAKASGSNINSTTGVSRGGAESSGNSAVARSTKGLEGPAFHDPHVKECYYHFKTGHCRLGPRCPYSHEAVDGQFSSTAMGAASMGLGGLGMGAGMLPLGVTATGLGIPGLGVAGLGVPGMGTAGPGLGGLGGGCMGYAQMLTAGMGAAGLGHMGLGVACMPVPGMGSVGYGLPGMGFAGMGGLGLGAFPTAQQQQQPWPP